MVLQIAELFPIKMINLMTHTYYVLLRFPYPSKLISHKEVYRSVFTTCELASGALSSSRVFCRAASSRT